MVWLVVYGVILFILLAAFAPILNGELMSEQECEDTGGHRWIDRGLHLNYKTPRCSKCGVLYDEDTSQ